MVQFTLYQIEIHTEPVKSIDKLILNYQYTQGVKEQLPCILIYLQASASYCDNHYISKKDCIELHVFVNTEDITFSMVVNVRK